ncbi:hypothetical protein POVWA2_022600 [Plasmodium ovale wallikeri]|uniref:Uncharacterized protein n=1 Tax=Plasmodium ovale wallikeri TaxID=864142 RepID=A0A1A8YS89_PLAOA|nr:hypothetical protein POVWA1_022810 [Plasmodium ovale wallikeri]SBT34964.1 hypothetical protein POVWA2_022600 [Plasmodium ovale wallikeri]
MDNIGKKPIASNPPVAKGWFLFSRMSVQPLKSSEKRTAVFDVKCVKKGKYVDISDGINGEMMVAMFIGIMIDVVIDMLVGRAAKGVYIILQYL